MFFSIKITLFTLSLGFLGVSAIAQVDCAIAESSSLTLPRLSDPQFNPCGYPLTKSKIPCLIRGLQSSNHLTRRFSAGNLGELGEVATEAVPDLINICRKDQGKWVRIYACSALGEIGLPISKILPSLRLVLADPDLDLKRCAATALGMTAVKIQNSFKIKNLSQTDLNIAISELQLSLQILKSPNANFNREPIERVTTSLDILKAHTR